MPIAEHSPHIAERAAPNARAFDRVALEFALDGADLSDTGFSACVECAAASVGGEMLFDMPNDGSLDDTDRIAALTSDRGAIVFVLLSADRTQIRIADDGEIDERFYGFAKAFVGVLSRIRTDQPIIGALEAEGTA